MDQNELRGEKICYGQQISDGQTDGRTGDGWSDGQKVRLITKGHPQSRTIINAIYSVKFVYKHSFEKKIITLHAKK